MTDNTKLSIRVSPSDLLRLKRFALDHGMTLTELTLKALAEYIEKEETKEEK